MLNPFETHTMLMAVEQLVRVPSFLSDRYFPTNDATDLFSTDDVLAEYREGNKKLAPFVSPRRGGVTITREGYEMKRFTPARIAPKRTLTIDDLQRKGFGEALYANLTPEQRQLILLMGDFDDLQSTIRRRIEQMAAETLLTNGCVMKYITDDPNKPEEKNVQFDPEQTASLYTPATEWKEETADIIADIAAAAGLLTSRGLPATDLIVGTDVADAILNNEKILKLLDNRNVQIGGISPEQLPNGATKIARLNCKGKMVDVILYEETYEDDKGKTTHFIDPKKAILTAPSCGRTIYGAVTQLEQSDQQYHTYTGKVVPKYTANADSNTREITLTSCPLLIPNNKNPWVVINAINA